MKIEAVMEAIAAKCRVTPSYEESDYLRRLCRAFVFGIPQEGYKFLEATLKELMAKNLGSYYDFETDDENRFTRCFFVLGASMVPAVQLRFIY